MNIELVMKKLHLNDDEKRIVSHRMRNVHAFDAALKRISAYEEARNKKIPLKYLKDYAIVREMALLMPIFNNDTNRQIVRHDKDLSALYEKIEQSYKMIFHFEAKSARSGFFGKAPRGNPLDVFVMFQPSTGSAKSGAYKRNLK